MRGRKPKSRRLRLVEGNRGKRKLPPGIPARSHNGKYRAPDFLDLFAKKEFYFAVRELENDEMMSPLFVPHIATWAESYATYKDAMERCRRGGKVIIGTKGNKITSPWWRIARDSKRDMMKAAGECGLTGISYQRVARIESGKKNQDPAAEFFS